MTTVKGMTMNDTELREQFHGIIVRMERFEARMDSFEKRLGDLQTGLQAGLADIRAEFRPRLDGIESRLADKASQVVVSIWGGTLAGLLAIAVMILLKFR